MVINRSSTRSPQVLPETCRLTHGLAVDSLLDLGHLSSKTFGVFVDPAERRDVGAEDLSDRGERVGSLQGELVGGRLSGERVHLPDHRRQVGREVVKLVVQPGSQTSPARQRAVSVRSSI